MITMLFAAHLALAKPPPSPEKIEAMKQRREGSLKVGDRAPDAPVVLPDGTPSTLLASKKDGRPLVLIFGSFT
jgi:hypothetical protein